MVEARVVLTNKLGLHARSAAMLTKVAAKFESVVHLYGASKSANVKSVLMVMALGVTKGAELTITAHGPDEAACLAALTDLIANNFYEE
ncbi:MAG: HPr family phosphocarrier protein [Firmicutes bacterium]|nr:HPr family phosphocarrier protein [Dethiobacter sp.]MBS3887702.1 HPr family phosphocarrier protein [Bacillota bacterium]MBS4053838.1 HPr family phosphocarrier protein [Thermaerobacter sp.]